MYPGQNSNKNDFPFRDNNNNILTTFKSAIKNT